MKELDNNVQKGVRINQGTIPDARHPGISCQEPQSLSVLLGQSYHTLCLFLIGTDHFAETLDH